MLAWVVFAQMRWTSITRPRLLRCHVTGSARSDTTETVPLANLPGWGGCLAGLRTARGHQEGAHLPSVQQVCPESASVAPRAQENSVHVRCACPQGGEERIEGGQRVARECLERSLGMASSSVRCCCSFSSRRSLARADCVMAARCMLPSGFFTILMGDTSSPDRLDCPFRNAGSAWATARSHQLRVDPGNVVILTCLRFLR